MAQSFQAPNRITTWPPPYFSLHVSEPSEMVRGVGVSPDSGKIEAKLVPFKYLLLLLANFKFSYLPTTLYTSTTWYDDMWRKNNNIIHSIQWSLERTIYNPKIWCYDQNDNAYGTYHYSYAMIISFVKKKKEIYLAKRAWSAWIKKIPKWN